MDLVIGFNQAINKHRLIGRNEDTWRFFVATGIVVFDFELFIGGLFTSISRVILNLS